MSKSYNGGSTIINTRKKGWYISKQKIKKKNNDMENERLANIEKQKNLMLEFQSEFKLIKKEKENG